MNYINIYLKIIKNKLNYDLIYLNKKKYILWNCILNNNILKKDLNLFLKYHKILCKQNGFKFILMTNWYKFGIKYNLIINLFNKW